RSKARIDQWCRGWQTLALLGTFGCILVAAGHSIAPSIFFVFTQPDTKFGNFLLWAWGAIALLGLGNYATDPWGGFIFRLLGVVLITRAVVILVFASELQRLTGYSAVPFACMIVIELGLLI